MFAQKNNTKNKAKVIKQILDAIPHPVEIAGTIFKIDKNASLQTLHSPQEVNQYRNAIKQALNMGVYHADLEFMIMLRKGKEIGEYVDALNRLSILLETEGWLEYNFMKDLAQNTTRHETMLEISQRNFEKVNRQLQSNGELHLNALFITGAWIESTYLAGQIYQKNRHEILREKIAEQKIPLDGIVLFLKNFSQRNQFKTIATDMLQLQELYQKVRVIIEYGESKIVEKNGELIIESQNTTKAEVSEEDLDKILQAIGVLRNKIIK